MPIRPVRPRRPKLLWLALAAGALLTSAAPGREVDPTDEEIKRLRGRVLALRQQAAVDGVTIDRLRQEIAHLKEELSTSSRASNGRISEPNPVAPIARNNAPIESSELESVPVPAGRPPVPDNGPSAQAGNAPGGPTGDSTTPTSPAPVGEDLQSIYDDGYTLFHQKQYSDAEARFAAFLARSPQSDLADNAQFWIGECHYARGDYPAALEAFTEVVDRFPKGNKVPDAMLKAAKTLEATGDIDAARTTYREVETRFPGTAAAAIAGERLAELR